MARKSYDMQFLLNAQLGSGYQSTFSRAQAEIVRTQKEITELNRQQGNIAAWQKQQAAVAETEKKYQNLIEQMRLLDKQISETTGSTTALEREKAKLQGRIDETGARLEKQKDKLQQTDAALKEAGIDTGNLAGASADLKEKTEALRKEQEEAADSTKEFGASSRAAMETLYQAAVSIGVVKLLGKITDQLKECAEASREFESAMTGVAKTTDLSDTELAEMAQAVKELSTEIPITTTELAGVAEVAGQLGIAKEDLLDFSTTMSMLATATTMTADEAATMLAQFANITRMDPSNYGRLASTIVDLGNNFATTEQKITEMAQGIAAAGSIAGMSEADMAALAAAVTSLGIETQAGATSMSKLISAMMTAVETGEDLEEIAEIAGMTAEEFSTAFGQDAVSALQAFITGLNDTERNGKSATLALTELGITETRMQRMILSLANSGDLLNRTLETAGRAWKENTALTAEAEKRYATTESQMILMQNAVNNLKVSVGDALNPMLADAYGITAKLANALAEMAANNPAVVRGITVFTIALGVAVGGLAAYTVAVKIAQEATKAFGRTAAISLGPLMIAMVAISGLIAGIVALTTALNKHFPPVEKLTAASQEQSDEIRRLERQYREVCATMGETSVEAQRLKRRIEEETAAFEENRQTVEMLAAKHRELMDAHADLMDSYQNTEDDIRREASASGNLLDRLEELTAAERRTTSQKQELAAVVAMLNESVPELGISYDAYTDSLNMSVDAIRAAAEAERKRQEVEKRQERFNELYQEQYELKADLEAQSQQLAAAEAERERVAEEFANGSFLAATAYNVVMTEVSRSVEDAAAAEEEARAAYEESGQALSELSDELAGYTAGMTDEEKALQDLLSETTRRLQQLEEEYGNAYAAAYESVSGQYSLWDQAAQVVATSATEINSALESQQKYWSDYNTNLQNLSARTGDIEGLSEMIATFADGSTESVNAIAGMAAATDDELRTMVANWQGVQAQQQEVSASMATLVTDYGNQVSDIVATVEQGVQQMKLDTEARAAANATLDAYIAAASGKQTAVYNAYAAVAQAAANALNGGGNPGHPRGGNNRYASGTQSAEAGMALVGEEGPELVLFRGGEQVLNARQTAALGRELEAVAFAPQLMAAAGRAGGGGPVSVQITVEGSASADTAEALRRAGAEIGEQVRAALRQERKDQNRRRYQ